MNLKQFLIDNYVYIIVIIILVIVTIIGFLADKKKNEEKGRLTLDPTIIPNNQNQLNQPNQQYMNNNGMNQMNRVPPPNGFMRTGFPAQQPVNGVNQVNNQISQANMQMPAGPQPQRIEQNGAVPNTNSFYNPNSIPNNQMNNVSPMNQNMSMSTVPNEVNNNNMYNQMPNRVNNTIPNTVSNPYPSPQPIPNNNFNNQMATQLPNTQINGITPTQMQGLGNMTNTQVPNPNNFVNNQNNPGTMNANQTNYMYGPNPGNMQMPGQ